MAHLARNLRSQSHLLAWYYGTFIVLVAMILFCFLKANSFFTYNQLQYIETYRRLEQAEFEKQSKEKAQQLAQATVKHFLDNKRTKKEWDLISQLKLNRLEVDSTVVIKLLPRNDKN